MATLRPFLFLTSSKIFPNLSDSMSGFPLIISQWSKEQFGKALPLVFSLNNPVNPNDSATGRKALRIHNGVPSTYISSSIVPLLEPMTS